MKQATSVGWHCDVCGATGVGGTTGWTAHYIAHHQDPKF